MLSVLPGTDSSTRAALYGVALLVWGVALLAMTGIAYVSHLAAFTDQAGNSGEAGMIWFLLGPAIPLWTIAAAAVVYSGWDDLDRVAPRALRVAASTIPLTILAFGLGLLAPGAPVIALAMEASLTAHAATFLYAHVAT